MFILFTKLNPQSHALQPPKQFHGPRNTQMNEDASPDIPAVVGYNAKRITPEK